MVQVSEIPLFSIGNLNMNGNDYNTNWYHNDWLPLYEICHKNIISTSSYSITGAGWSVDAGWDPEYT